MHGVNLDAAGAGARDGAAGQTARPPPGAAPGGAGRGRRPGPRHAGHRRSATTASTGRRVFAAAKIGGLKNYFIEQEQANGWDCMVKGAAYLKTLKVD